MSNPLLNGKKEATFPKLITLFLVECPVTSCYSRGRNLSNSVIEEENISFSSKNMSSKGL